jgi:hypothetical protein
MKIGSQIKVTEVTKFTVDDTQKSGVVDMVGTVKKVINDWCFLEVKDVNYRDARQVKVIKQGQIIRRKLTLAVAYS